MTNERAVEILNLDLDILGQYGCETAEAYKMAIKALEAQPCEDCISREEMLKYQQYLHGKMSNEENHKLWNFIKGLPSVKPKYTDGEIDKAQAVEQAYVDKMVELAVEEAKRPKGKWIDDCGGVKCSCCGYSINDNYYAKAYCTNCGAEMGGADETN